MKNRFFLKMVLFVCLFFFLDKMIGIIGDYYMQNQKRGDYFAMQYKMLQAKPSIVIFGSSRANSHYNPAIFEEKLHQKTINYGASGSDIFYYYVVFKSLLKYTKPKTLVLDIKPDEFDKKFDGQSILELYPLFHKLDITKEDLNEVSDFEFLKVALNSFRYSSVLPSLIKDSKGKPEDTTHIDGFAALPQSKNEFDHSNKNYYNVEAINFSYFVKIVDLCNQENIDLKVCTSPYYNKIVFDQGINKLQKYCENRNIPFYNYLNNNLLYFQEKDFRDNGHLNIIGANKFTEDFIKRAFKQP